MSSPVGGARDWGAAGVWQRGHERNHDRRDAELDRRYLALSDKADRQYQALEKRLRNVERALYIGTGVLSATTATAIFNLITNLAGG